MKIPTSRYFAVISIIVVMLACSWPGVAGNQPPTSQPDQSTSTPDSSGQTGQATATSTISPPTVEVATPTITIPHSLIPSTDVVTNKLVVRDVVSADTAPEKRAPYGDLYRSNLFERPFMQDMTYVSDLDIVAYSLSYDEIFYYVSIELVGSNPNNEIGINYAVELDINADGFGDYIIIARPPYNVKWSTDNVQIAKDTNRDTGGLSGEKSDAPIPGDGYDTVIFDGGSGEAEDLDLAWVRVNAGKQATVQFAFKKDFSGIKFMYGVLADAGPKNIEDLDYVDRFTEAEAGSPEKSEKEYPLKALYGVDNVCREAFGFTGSGDEPQRCKTK